MDGGPNFVVGDLVVGGAIGIVGATQGVALPGLLLIGVGFDAVAAAVRAVDPKWFPNSEPLSLFDVLATTLGTAAGWAVVRAVSPRPNPAGAPPGAVFGPRGAMLATGMAAGLVMLPTAGRAPGRLRRATYRGTR
jgi:hypothetical protein